MKIRVESWDVWQKRSGDGQWEDRRQRRDTGAGHVWTVTWVKRKQESSPAHPALQQPLAITAVGSPGLGVTAVTVTQCVQLHSQLL